MIADPDNQKHRGECLEALTQKLAGLLRFLAPPGKERAFCKVLKEEIIEAAFRLQESFLCSSHEYSFQFQDASEVRSRVLACGSTQELAELLDTFDLRNAAKNHSKLVFQKLPSQSLRAFQDGFRAICTLYPALMFVDAEKPKGGGSREPFALEVPRVLVAWTPPRGQGSKNSSSRAGQQNESWIHRLLQAR